MLKKKIIYIISILLPVVVFVLINIPLKREINNNHGIMFFSVQGSIDLNHQWILTLLLMSGLALFVCSIVFILRKAPSKIDLIITISLIALFVVFTILTFMACFLWSSKMSAVK